MILAQLTENHIMTDRIHSITLALEKDMRVDDAEALIEACKMLKGVLHAKGNISDHGQYVTEARVRSDIGEKLFDIIYPKDK